MTVLDVAAPGVQADEIGLFDAYAAAQPVLGGSVEYQRVRVRAAHRFLTDHPDLTVWMPTDPTATGGHLSFD